ncbi:hypothetical protein HDU76_002757 [Blyttiomyces sp. JEL0837]|nr:hypothetical protein HDU76_002757 [Blyttiomyces sp. JEL0837]
MNKVKMQTKAPAAPPPESIDPTQLSTFNLSLTDSQKIAREESMLPFMDAQEAAVPLDDYDDYDSDDPDSDLFL